MHPHRQISVYVDAEIADGLHWSDVEAVNQHSSGWKLMLEPDFRAPQNLGFVQIKLQPISFRPGRNGINVFGDLR